MDFKHLQQSGKKVEMFVILALVALFGIIFALTRQSAVVPSETAEQAFEQPEQESVRQVPTTTIIYQGVAGKTALELLQATHNVETKDFGDLGQFVTSIDGVSPNPQTHFWALYVNGSQAQVGAGQYVAKSSDQIEWRLEEIKM